MNLITASILLGGLTVALAFFLGRWVGIKRGRDEQWVADYLAYERKTQAGRDKLGRFQKRKAKYGKIKIPAQQNQL